MKLLLLAVHLFCVTGIMAQEADNENRKIEFNAELTTEVQMNGKGRFNSSNLLRLETSIPFSDALSLDVASLTSYMSSGESIGEDLQTFSNIDAEKMLFALAVCGINWQIDDRNALFLGVRNMNEDYFASPVTAFFTNSSCGIYPTISMNYPVPNYPVAAVGAHYRYEKALNTSADGNSDALVFQASLYNGAGYNRFTGRDNIFHVSPRKDGVFGITEAQYEHMGSRYFLGNILYYNKEMSTTPWAYIEQRLSDRLTLLAGYSHAFDKDEECRDFYGMGLHYQFPKVELGLFTDYAKIEDTKEWATELTCCFSLARHISLQPVSHLIKTGDKFSSAFALRLKIDCGL